MAPYIIAGRYRSHGSMRRLREEQRTKRRTVADVLDVVRQVLGLEDPPQSKINLGPLLLPSGEWTALVDVVFPDLDCIVTLPTSARFRARSATNSEHQEYDISRLDGADVASDGSVRLVDGTQLRMVEVVPTHLPYEPSQLDRRILSNVSVRLEELSRFVEAPIRPQLGDLEKTFERAAAEMRQLYATLLRKRRLQKQITNDVCC